MFADAKDPEPAGYSITYDNVQFTAHAKHQTQTSRTKCHIMALAFAAVSRVHPEEPAELIEGPKMAVDISPSSFIATHEDVQFMKDRMEVMVSRILVHHMAVLEPLKTNLQWHIPHQHSDEMNQKSELINLGVFQGNPSSVPDTIDILDNLLAYVPVTEDGTTFPVPLYGDGGTVASVAKAKKGRALSSSPTHSLQCLIEGAQEFHKDGILLEVCILSHEYNFFLYKYCY